MIETKETPDINKLKKIGFTQVKVKLAHKFCDFVKNEDFPGLDKLVKELLFEQQDNELYQLIKRYANALNLDNNLDLDYMIAQRLGPQAADQEGIWHDDSSRHFVLSLSIYPNDTFATGEGLLIRPKAQRSNITQIPPRACGQGHIFLTGHYGHEHKTCSVTSGKRVVLVVWAGKTGLVE